MRSKHVRRFHAFVGACAIAVAAGSAAADESTTTPGLLDSALFGQVPGSGPEANGFFDSIQFDGQIDVGYTYNFNHTMLPGFPENPIRVFDVFHNQFTVHNAILNVHREADADHLFGFSLMPAFGTDGAITQLNGFNFGGNDLDLIEAYGSMYVPDDIPLLNGATIEVGKFLTSAGAEYIPSGENVMFSRSFLFGNAIPFTHTGVRLTKGLLPRGDEEDMLTLMFGFANGWDALRDTNDGHVFLTGASLEPFEGFTTALNWFFGNTDRAGIGDDDSISHLIDIVSTYDFADTGFSISLNFDWYGDENNGTPPIAAGAGYANYWGLSGIAKYEFDNPFSATEDDKFYAAFRGEYVEDPDNFLTGLNAALGNSDFLYDLTWTLGYRPSEVVLCRVELRYDKAENAIFDNGSRHHQTTIAFNTVFSF